MQASLNCRQFTTHQSNALQSLARKARCGEVYRKEILFQALLTASVAVLYHHCKFVYTY